VARQATPASRTVAAALAPNQPSFAKREKAAAPEPNGRRRATRPARYVSASKNIENNPMHSKEPLEKKGSPAWMPYPAKNILTRRANQRHESTIAPIVDLPMALPIGFLPRWQAKNSDRNKGQ
jgi:hypothetical protein